MFEYTKYSNHDEPGVRKTWDLRCAGVEACPVCFARLEHGHNDVKDCCVSYCAVCDVWGCEKDCVTYFMPASGGAFKLCAGCRETD